MLSLFSTSLLLSVTLPLIFFFTLSKLRTIFKTASSSSSPNLPKSYPFIGSFFTILKNRDRFTQWSSDIVTASPSLTFSLHRNFRQRFVITANPAVVQHILKSNFYSYDKGEFLRTNLRDLLGDGIFNSDGEKWKFQRQVASHEFNNKSLRKFVETAVDSEISGRLVPILAAAAAEGTVLDLQDILQRFAFDNICKIAFGYDPEYLSASLPEEKFAVAFEKAVKLSSERFATFSPYSWKMKKALNIGSEKQLRIAVREVREFAIKLVREKKQEMERKSSTAEDEDLLSRFLRSGHSDEDFVTDIVISFILAGRDTTSTALTWFFWLLSDHQQVENEILKEIKEKSSNSASAYDEVKEMVYTHASLCESMRLYPPVPMDSKEAQHDDVLPEGTLVKKGMRVSYHPYAMGRVEKVWGKDWAAFRPERWLQRDDKWNFVGRDAYTYPVFQAGPRICLGKDMAFIQMKRVVAAVLRRFRVVPDGLEPQLVVALTAKMKGGFPVRIEARDG